MRETDARDRGQSEALGFLLIFGVVVLTIALVGVAGFTGLESIQDFQRTTNAEQGFVALANNIDDVLHEGAPGRTTEIRIAGGTLSLATTETTVEITDTDGTTNTTTVTTNPIVYESGTNTTLTYRSGAVIRSDSESDVMLREPGFVLTEDRVILPLVNGSLATGKVGGTTEVNVRTRAGNTELLASGDRIDKVTVTVTSPHAAAWARYFERFEAGGPVTDIQRSGNSVEVEIDTDRAYVTVYRINIRFQ